MMWFFVGMAAGGCVGWVVASVTDRMSHRRVALARRRLWRRYAALDERLDRFVRDEWRTPTVH